MGTRLFFCALLIQLAGCSIFADSDEPEEQPIALTQLTYSLVATDHVNPNASGDATPIEVHVYELEDDSMFLSADYDVLVDDAEDALKSNYIGHRDFVLVPGQFKFIDAFEVEEGSRYIGVMGRFADPDASDWKKVVKIFPVGRQYHLLMHFNDKEINLEKVE